MAVPMSPKQKVYQGILNEIRYFIEINELKSGDRLPSERELAEKLHASRSSVREALRSMELLGLIDVRHGEGTYLSTYRPFQMVELLASFILLESNTKKEVMFVKQTLEKEGIKHALEQLTDSDIRYLHTVVSREDYLVDKHILFFEHIFKSTNNLFLLKIWGLMQDFTEGIQQPSYDKIFYTKILKICENKNYESIDPLFETLN